MKPVYCMLVFLLSASSVIAIDFSNISYSEAIHFSKQQNKPVFLYFTATWCGPCHYMEQNIFPDATLTALVKQQYIALRIDADSEEGKKLCAKFDIKGYPSFIVLTDKEQVQKKETGAMKLSQLARFLSKDTVSAKSKAKPDTVINAKTDTAKRNKAGFFSRFYYTASVSKWKPGIQIGIMRNHLQHIAAESGSTMGYSCQFFLDYRKHKFGFQPGVEFSTAGGKTAGINNAVRYLTIPLSLSYIIAWHNYFGGGFQGIRFHAAPYAAMRLSGNTQVDPANMHVIAFQNFDYGAKLGLSMDAGSFQASAGYMMGFADVSRNPVLAASNRSYYFSIAVIVGR